jgi:hypothetical protein
MQSFTAIMVNLSELIFGLQAEPENAGPVQIGKGPKSFDLDQERPSTAFNG